MAEITKQDIKGAVLEALEPFAKSVQADFVGVNKRLDGVEQQLGGHGKAFAGINQRLDILETDVKFIKDNAGELFTKLDEFISLYRDTKQETDLLAKQVRRLEERVSQLEGKA
ncbi:hypothetical protein D4R51_00235 [bacterium]|nr:MAG: hypothetical protein D4R51_00235 [bacterium]